MTNPNERTDPADLPYDSSLDTAGKRGDDDRRGEVRPDQNPAPRSPEPDEQATREGEEKLNSVKPY